MHLLVQTGALRSGDLRVLFAQTLNAKNCVAREISRENRIVSQIVKHELLQRRLGSVIPLFVLHLLAGNECKSNTETISANGCCFNRLYNGGGWFSAEITEYAYSTL